MKYLWVMRHAKSDRSIQGLSDFDRPLNLRGRKDSTRMGKWMRGLSNRPEMVISSPALRARETSERVAGFLGVTKQITWWDTLYPGQLKSTLSQVKGLPREILAVLIVGHNPHLEDIVSYLSSDGYLDLTLSTAAVALLESDTEDWEALPSLKARLRGIVSPKILG